MRISWVRPSIRYANVPGDQRANFPNHADYDQIIWRPPHTTGVRFGELDSYDIRGLCAMILRWVPFHRIRYILGATGEGSRFLTRHPEEPLSQFNTIWIENNESLRAWLLSNPVLLDPLNLLVYGYRDADDQAPDTPELRGHDYLDEDDVQDWGAALDVTVGQMHFRARAPGAGAKDRENNQQVQQGNQGDHLYQHPEMGMTSSLASQEEEGSGDEDEINTKQSRELDDNPRATGPDQSPMHHVPPGLTAWFRDRLRSSPQQDGRKGVAWFDAESPPGTKPIANRHKPTGLLLPPPAPNIRWKRRASFDFEAVLGVKPKRHRMGFLDTHTLASDVTDTQSVVPVSA